MLPSAFEETSDVLFIPLIWEDLSLEAFKGALCRAVGIVSEALQGAGGGSFTKNPAFGMSWKTAAQMFLFIKSQLLLLLWYWFWFEENARTVKIRNWTFNIGSTRKITYSRPKRWWKVVHEIACIALLDCAFSEGFLKYNFWSVKLQRLFIFTVHRMELWASQV